MSRCDGLLAMESGAASPVPGLNTVEAPDQMLTGLTERSCCDVDWPVLERLTWP